MALPLLRPVPCCHINFLVHFCFHFCSHSRSFEFSFTSLLDPSRYQILASVRISQQRPEEAKQILLHSIDMWKDRSEDDLPSFEFRTNCAKLLIELGLHQHAAEILKRLTLEVRVVH